MNTSSATFLHQAQFGDTTSPFYSPLSLNGYWQVRGANVPLPGTLALLLGSLMMVSFTPSLTALRARLK